MSWTSMSEFLHMGGYGLYVWGAYAVTLGLLAVEAIALVWKERAIVADLARALRRTEAR
jgi:heme exporter protein D